MERFVLEGRKLNGPPAAREVNATLKQRQLEDEYVQHSYLFIVLSRLYSSTVIPGFSSWLPLYSRSLFVTKAAHTCQIIRGYHTAV